MISRRHFLLGAAGALGAAGLGAASLSGLLAPGQPGRQLTSEVPLPVPFQLPLPIPPVLAPARTDAVADYYEITQRVTDQVIIPGLRTPLWTYGGIFPGPTANVMRIRIDRADYPGRYVFHCHNLEHEDMAMMANLVTT